MLWMTLFVDAAGSVQLCYSSGVTARSKALVPVVWAGQLGRNVALGAAGATVVLGAFVVTPFALLGSVIAKSWRAGR